MDNKKLKKISPITLILIISLLLNSFLVIDLKYHKRFLNEEIYRSLRLIESDLMETKEILEQIIAYKKIDDYQHTSIYNAYTRLSKEYKNLYHYYYTFESTKKDFSDINSLFEMKQFLYDFGKVYGILAYTREKDKSTKIDLTESEVESFKSFYKKNSEYISIFKVWKNDRNDIKKDIWVKIVEGLYEKGIYNY